MLMAAYAAEGPRAVRTALANLPRPSSAVIDLPILD